MHITNKSTIIRAIKGFNKKEKTGLITKYFTNEKTPKLEAFLLNQLISPKFKQPKNPKEFLVYSEGNKGDKLEGTWENDIIRFTTDGSSLHIDVKDKEALVDNWGRNLSTDAVNPNTSFIPRVDLLLPPDFSDFKNCFAQITKLIADVTSDGVLIGVKVEVDDSWAWFSLRKIYPFLLKNGRVVDFTKMQIAFASSKTGPWIFYPPSYELRSCFGIVMPMVPDYWEELSLN